jgi:anti-sigma B factor antagonist
MPNVDELLWVERLVENHTVIVRASGELDMLTAPVLSRQLELAEAIVVPPAPVVLDLKGITFFSSAGLSVLLTHRERCMELGSRLQIVASSRVVIRAVVLTGLADILVVLPVSVGGQP